MSYRSFRRRPTYTGVVVLTIGLGIGASTSMFSIVNRAGGGRRVRDRARGSQLTSQPHAVAQGCVPLDGGGAGHEGKSDPGTFVVVSLLLAAVALVACYVPALRAASVAPQLALKSE